MGRSVRATVDDSGRLVLPETFRDEVGIAPGMTFEITVLDGRVEIEPAGEVRIIQRGPLWVAVSTEPVELLRESLVEEVRQEIRDRGA